MGKAGLGLFLGAVVGSVGTYTVIRLERENSPPCQGLCGDGTACTDGVCLPAVAESEPLPKGKKKRKRRRKRGSANDAAGLDPDLPPFQAKKDDHIPKFNPNKVQLLDMDGGSERISDEVIRRHMIRLEPQFNKCLETAALYSETEIGAGEIVFVFGVKASGKVSSVTAKAPKNLRAFGIVPCVRKAVFDHRFPTFDGPDMGVDYSFSVG